LFSPSALALFTPSSMAAKIPSRCLRMVLETLTNGGRRERVALEHHRSSSAPVSSVQVAQLVRVGVAQVVPRVLDRIGDVLMGVLTQTVDQGVVVGRGDVVLAIRRLLRPGDVAVLLVVDMVGRAASGLLGCLCHRRHRLLGGLAGLHAVRVALGVLLDVLGDRGVLAACQRLRRDAASGWARVNHTRIQRLWRHEGWGRPVRTLRLRAIHLPGGHG